MKITPRWTKPRCWKHWEVKPVYAGTAHHWDLYVAPTRVYGVTKGTQKKSFYEGWENDGFIRATKPDPELIAKINAMRMMLCPMMI